jgi:hypothetical protein
MEGRVGEPPLPELVLARREALLFWLALFCRMGSAEAMFRALSKVNDDED